MLTGFFTPQLQALAVGYPEESRYKLSERLGRVYLKMGLIQWAKTSFLISEQLLLKSTLAENKKDEFKTMLEKLTNECELVKPLEINAVAG